MLTGRRFVFAWVAAILCAGLFSLGPLVSKSAAPTLPTRSREGNRRAGTGRRQHRLRRSLVFVQIALGGWFLLAGAGLLVRTVIAMQHVDLGFHADGMLTFRGVRAVPAIIAGREPG